MATVYQRGPGNFWVAFRIDTRRRYWRDSATFGEAEKARTKIASDVAAGKIGLEVERDPVPSLGELFELWQKRRQKTHRSAKEDRWRWDRHLAMWLTHLRPEEDVLRAIKLLPANDTHQDAQSKRRRRLSWYRCTRHTFASHWVMDGRPIEMLKEILGHSTVQVTERYPHLRMDLFRAEDLAAMSVDLSPNAVRLRTKLQRNGSLGDRVASSPETSRGNVSVENPNIRRSPTDAPSVA